MADKCKNSTLQTRETLNGNGASLHFHLTPAAYGGAKQCGEPPHHLTPPCQQSRLCAEAHRGIVGKPAGVMQHLVIGL